MLPNVTAPATMSPRPGREGSSASSLPASGGGAAGAGEAVGASGATGAGGGTAPGAIGGAGLGRLLARRPPGRRRVRWLPRLRGHPLVRGDPPLQHRALDPARVDRHLLAQPARAHAHDGPHPAGIHPVPRRRRPRRVLPRPRGRVRRRQVVLDVRAWSITSSRRTTAPRSPSAWTERWMTTILRQHRSRSWARPSGSTLRASPSTACSTRSPSTPER